MVHITCLSCGLGVSESPVLLIVVEKYTVRVFYEFSVHLPILHESGLY